MRKSAKLIKDSGLISAFMQDVPQIEIVVESKRQHYVQMGDFKLPPL